MGAFSSYTASGPERGIEGLVSTYTHDIALRPFRGRRPRAHRRGDRCRARRPRAPARALRQAYSRQRLRGARDRWHGYAAARAVQADQRLGDQTRAERMRTIDHEAPVPRRSRKASPAPSTTRQTGKAMHHAHAQALLAQRWPHAEHGSDPKHGRPLMMERCCGGYMCASYSDYLTRWRKGRPAALS